MRMGPVHSGQNGTVRARSLALSATISDVNLPTAEMA